MLSVLRIDLWAPRQDGRVPEGAWGRKFKSNGYQVSTFTWPAGTVVAAQAQDRERVDAVVAGILKITLDGESAILTAGDMVYVPQGSVRRVEVVCPPTAHCLDAVSRA